MIIITSKSVNFGGSRTGLATVGYALVNYDGSVHTARTITGVVEAVAGSGIYAANITFPDSWSGLIVWDTGEDTARYACEDYDYRHYSASATVAVGGYGVAAGTGLGKDVWTEKEKKRLLKAIKQIFDKLGIAQDQLTEKIGGLSTEIEQARKENRIPDPAILQTNAALKEINEALETLAEATVVLAENQEMRDILQEAESHVEAQLAKAEG